MKLSINRILEKPPQGGSVFSAEEGLPLHLDDVNKAHHYSVEKTSQRKRFVDPSFWLRPLAKGVVILGTLAHFWVGLSLMGQTIVAAAALFVSVTQAKSFRKGPVSHRFTTDLFSAPVSCSPKDKVPRQVGDPLEGSTDEVPVEHGDAAETEDVEQDSLEARCGDCDETYKVTNKRLEDPYGENGIYTGTLSKATGLPHGMGRLEYAAERWYEGEWKHGRWTGQARLSNGDGDLYEGELRNDKKHGKGKMGFADGRVFVGEYMAGEMTEGKMIYQDGSTYEGQWADGMRHGKGKCVFTDEAMYEGEFQEGEFHGRGKMVWSDGGWYEGDWHGGEMEGFGKEIRPDGSLRHEGRWSKGKPLRNLKRKSAGRWEP